MLIILGLGPLLSGYALTIIMFSIVNFSVERKTAFHFFILKPYNVRVNYDIGECKLGSIGDAITKFNSIQWLSHNPPILD